MGKAINALVNRAEEENDSYNPNVVRLSCVDVLHPKGSRDRAIVKVPRRAPTVTCITKIRKVTYLYDKDKVTHGWEIVKEHTVPRADEMNYYMFEPEIVEEVTRDLRTKVNSEEV